MKEILKFLKKHPEIEKINSHIVRNEGYIKSLKKDKRVKFLLTTHLSVHPDGFLKFSSAPVAYRPVQWIEGLHGFLSSEKNFHDVCSVPP